MSGSENEPSSMALPGLWPYAPKLEACQNPCVGMQPHDHSGGYRMTTTVEVISDKHEEDKGHTMVVKWTQPSFDGYTKDE